MATVLTATRSSMVSIDVDGDGAADFGDTIRTTLVVTNTGAVEAATNVTVEDPNNGMTVTNIAPIAVGDFFTAVGNTVLRVGGAANIGSGPSSIVTGNVLTNDFDIGAGSNIFTLTAVTNGTSSQGGTFNLNADGSFNYVNQAGATGTDFFTYTITDRGADGIAGNSDDLSSTGRVTITITGEVWYVDSAAAAGGTGTSANPFNTMNALNGVTGDGTTNDDVDGDGDVIYVRGNAGGNGLVLEANQQLIGTNTALVVAGFTLAADTGVNSSITAASGTTLTLSSGNLLSGITVANTGVVATGAAVSGSSFGTVTVTDAVITSSTQGLILNTGAVAGSGFTSITSTSGSNNVNLTGVTGTLNLGSGTLSGAGSTAFAVNGGSVSVNYSGNLSLPGATIGALVSVGGSHTGTITFTTGTLSATNGTGLLLDNADGTYNFNGTTTLNGGDAGIDIQNGSSGTFNFGIAGSTTTTINSPTGIAFRVNNSDAAVTYNGAITQANNAALVDVTNHAGGKTITFQNGTLSGTNGTGLQFSNADGTYNFTGTTTLNGGDAGIDIIVGSGGNFNFGTGTSISNPTGIAFRVDGGNGNIDYNGSLAKNTDGRVIDVQNHSGGTVSFDGTVSSTVSGDGILLATNTGTTFAFTGALTLNTSTSNTIAFSATGGGTVTATATGSTITSGSGTAVNVVSTTIGAGGLNWQSINTNNANIGINLQNTGAGAFVVTGTSGVDSGGTILNATTGINLLNTGPLRLTDFNITGDVNSDDGIYGSGVTGLTLIRTDVSGSTDSGQTTDRGVEFVNLTGVATVTDSTFTNMPGHLFNVKNSSGTLNLIVTGSRFSGSNGALGDDGLLIEADGTSIIVARISNSIFDNNEGDHFQFATDGGASTSNITFSNNTLTTSNPTGILGGGITISPAGASDLTFAITGNTITGNVGGGAIDITTVSSTSAMLTQGTISGNQVGNAGVANSGSAQASGISVENNGNGTLTALVTNNTVTQVNGNYAIEVFSRAGTGVGGVINATVTNNTITNPGAFMLNGIRVTGGTSADIDTGRINVDIQNNTTDTTVAQDIRISSRADVDIFFAGYAGANNDTTAIDLYLEARNTGPENASVAILGGTPQLSGIPAGSVLLPASPTLPLLAAQQPPAPAADETAADPPSADLPSADLPAADLPPSDKPGEVEGPTDGQPVVVDDGILSRGELDLVVAAAIARWAAAGATEAQLATMRAVTFDVADLGGLQLGVSRGTTITLDDNAAGFNWFVDATPGDDSEFSGAGTRLFGLPDTAASARIDLLTTILHELGHQIGLDDRYDAADADNLLFGFVGMGERRLPAAGAADAGGTTPLESAAFALAPVNLGTLAPLQSFTLTWTSTVNTVPNNSVIPGYSSASTVSGGNFTTVVSNAVALVVDSLTIGNLVYLDANRNGVFDAGDSGIVGVTMSLFADADNNDIADGPAIATTTSLAGGAYSFGSLTPGNYIVSVNAANFTGGGVLVNRVTTLGGVDPDNDVDDDDNGIVGPGGTVVATSITLAYNTEPTAGLGNDSNPRLDFGFLSPNVAPAFANGSGQPSYAENAAPIAIATAVTATDDSTVYTGGTLTVGITTGSVAGDAITLAVSGTPGTGIEVAVANVSFNNVVVGTLVNAGTSFVVTLNAAATDAAVVALAQAARFASSSDNPGAGARTVTFTLVDGGGTVNAGTDTTSFTRTVAVVPSDDAPVAVADTPGTLANATVNVAVVGNDTDVDGGPRAVATINGTAVVANQVVTLASGATVRLEADGTLTYNPNGRFDYLVATAVPGAVNTSATDSFSYALNGGSSTTVTVTVAGVDGPGDEQRGNGGANTLTGTGAAEYFNLDQGGTDSVSAGGGDDLILFGGSYDPTDSIDGGIGTDQFGIRGNYTATLSNVIGTEYIAILSGTSVRYGGDGTARYDYNLTTTDATVAAGVQYVVQANELVAGEDLRFDGSAESDGRFLMYAGMGIDTLIGGAGNDAFYFGEGGRFTAADTVVGGLGTNDQLGLRGIYSVTFAATTISGIEVIALLSAKDVRFGPEAVAYNYNLVLNDGNVAAGARLTVSGGTLRSDESASINGAGETNGSFFFIGGAGADSFTGGAGEDRLFGGAGADSLRGGGGNDVFVYDDIAQSTPASRDAILDFTLGDRIDLSGIDANTTGAAPGDQAFAFIGAAAFGSVAGQLRVTANGGGWLVEGDTDGNGIADFAVQLTVPDAHPITATDFIL